MIQKKPNLKDYPIEKLASIFTELGEPSFRSKQIIKWLYQKRVEDFEKMTNIPKECQKKLSCLFTIEKLKILTILESKDKDAVKFGFKAEGSEYLIESVLLIDKDRRTACISSQLGCSMGCSFCETAKIGFIRNLTQAEIIGQLIAINDYLCEKKDKLVTNIVFMGMGEALLNFDNFVSCVKIITSQDGFCLGTRRITVSTSGIIPQIKKFIELKIPINLAISLNAYNNELRNKLMPINKKYPIESLLQIAYEYVKIAQKPVTFEYVLIHGINDGKQAISSLCSLLKNINCKVNVISLNSLENRENNLLEKNARDFVQQLFNCGLNATYRKSRGADIKGACGQLSGIYAK
jgi:23S rRNA (adenine2503-C2)-methyltransferase